MPPGPADAARLETEAQAIVDAFSGAVALARGGPLAATPVVQVRNTPQLIFFSRSSNQIVIPWWETTAPEMKSVFRTFAAGSDAEAEGFFRAFFNRFLIAHEAGHWFQDHAERRRPTLYENEDAANRLAVAFWRTQPGGERFLSELERLATRAAANLPDPTPPGEDPIVYFGANYQALGRDPLKYGYYQFRFMRDAIRDRSALDFARMVNAEQGSAARTQAGGAGSSFDCRRSRSTFQASNWKRIRHDETRHLRELPRQLRGGVPLLRTAPAWPDHGTRAPFGGTQSEHFS